MPTKKTPIKSLEGDMKTFNKNTIEAEKQKIKDEKMRAKMQAKHDKQQAKEVKPVDTVPIIRTTIKPKRKTAYTSYISQRYAELKASGMDSKEIFKELAVIWKNMTEEAKAGFKAS